MKKQNFVLQAALAACFATAAGQSAAVVNIPAGTGAVRVTNSLVSTTTGIDGAATLSLNVLAAPPAGIAPTTSNPVYLKLNLSNGAKFASVPSISCSASSAGEGTAGALTAVTGAIQAGGLNFNNVTFALTAQNGGAQSGVFVVGASGSGLCSATITALTISGLNNVAVSATFEYTNGLVQASSNATNNYVTFVDSFAATYSASTGTAVVDATSGSDNFVTGSNLTQGTAILGWLKFDRNTTAANTAVLGNDMDLGAALAAASGSVTISGPALAAMKGSPAGTASIYLSSAAACGAVVVDGAFDATGTNSVTFAGLTTGNITGGLYVCGTVTSGTQQILTGQITGQFGGTALSNVTISFPAAGNLQNIGQNGTTMNAYLVNASTSASKTSVIRIVNTGGNEGTVRATAYLVDDSSGTSTTAALTGVPVGTANSTIATLKANESVNLTSAVLENLLAYTPTKATDKYRVVFSAGLAAFKVLNYTKDVSGAITLSQAQDN